MLRLVVETSEEGHLHCSWITIRRELRDSRRLNERTELCVLLALHFLKDVLVKPERRSFMRRLVLTVITAIRIRIRRLVRSSSLILQRFSRLLRDYLRWSRLGIMKCCLWLPTSLKLVIELPKHHRETNKKIEVDLNYL